MNCPDPDRSRQGDSRTRFYMGFLLCVGVGRLRVGFVSGVARKFRGSWFG